MIRESKTELLTALISRGIGCWLIREIPSPKAALNEHTQDQDQTQNTCFDISRNLWVYPTKLRVPMSRNPFSPSNLKTQARTFGCLTSNWRILLACCIDSINKIKWPLFLLPIQNDLRFATYCFDSAKLSKYRPNNEPIQMSTETYSFTVVPTEERIPYPL